MCNYSSRGSNILLRHLPILGTHVMYRHTSRQMSTHRIKIQRNLLLSCSENHEHYQTIQPQVSCDPQLDCMRPPKNLLSQRDNRMYLLQVVRVIVVMAASSDRSTSESLLSQALAETPLLNLDFLKTSGFSEVTCKKCSFWILLSLINWKMTLFFMYPINTLIAI